MRDPTVLLHVLFRREAVSRTASEACFKLANDILRVAPVMLSVKASTVSFGSQKDIGLYQIRIKTSLP